MRSLGGWFLLPFLALAFFGEAVAQEAGSVLTTPLTPRVEARPGETVTLRLRVENTGNERVAFTPRVTPPIGWTVVIPPGDVQLEPGEARVVIFSLLVAPNAKARINIFHVTYFLTNEGPQHEATFAVRVPDIHQVSLALLEGPAYVTGDHFTTRFLLRNEGNSRANWTLTARSSASLPLELDPEGIALEPGEASVVLVHTSVPADLGVSIRHVLTLQAGHPDLPGVRAVARSTSELVPRRASITAAVHTFPLTARLSLEAGHDGALRPSGPIVELSGTGSLSDRDPGRLTVRLETHLARPFAPEELLVSYRGPDGWITVGDQSFSRSTLLSAQDGFGISAQRRWQLAPPATVTGSASAYTASTGPALTAAAQVAVGGGFDGAIQVHGSRGGLLATLDARYRAPVADPSQLELASLEGSYALRTATEPGSWGQAVRLRARVREGPSYLDLRYGARTAAFIGAERHEDSVDLRAALRLDEALSLDPSSPLDLHLVYSNERSWPTPNSAGESRGVRTLGGTLTARLGRTSLSLGHHDEVTQEGGTRTREATTHLQTYLPLGDRVTLEQELAWVRGTAVEDASQVRYEGGAMVALGVHGRLELGLDLGAALGGSGLSEADLRARWSGTHDDTFDLAAGIEADLLGHGEFIGVEIEGRKRFANDHRLEATLDAALREGASPRATVAVAYVVPFEVPIGLRSDTGTIRGTILASDGAPLAGVIVTTGGFTTVTRSDGVFLLPAVPAGEHLVHLVPDTVPVSSPVVRPAAPLAIEVLAGRSVDVAFEVTRGATVEGRLRPQALDATTDRAVLGPDTPADRWLQGAILELSDGTTTLRATTDAVGRFRLPRVPPGSWTLRLLHPDLPTHYRIEPTEHEIRVGAGDVARTEFRLVPVTRTIRFQDGGRLGGD